MTRASSVASSTMEIDCGKFCYENSLSCIYWLFLLCLARFQDVTGATWTTGSASSSTTSEVTRRHLPVPVVGPRETFLGRYRLPSGVGEDECQAAGAGEGSLPVPARCRQGQRLL